MIRDKRKDIKYFEKYIIEINSAISKGFKRIEEGLIAEERISISKIYHFKLCWHKLIANYSLGISFENMRSNLLKLSDLLPDYWQSTHTKVKHTNGEYMNYYFLEYYEILLQLLSLSILLNVPKIQNQIKVILQVDNVNELLLNTLLKNQSILGETYPPDSIVISVYADLRKSISHDDINQRPKFVLHFLKKCFYHKNASWYNNHNGRHDAYYGYWSFESAAIVAILDLDDSSFRDNEYYPKDLVDYYRANRGNHPA